MDREFLTDLFASFGPVTIRPMFSGFGISADGINFALALRSGVYFRADETTTARFEAAGSKPFQYDTKAKTVTVGSYWQVPAHLFDDADEFCEWARAALAAAQRAALTKRAKARKPSKKPVAKPDGDSKTGSQSKAPSVKAKSRATDSANKRAAQPTKTTKSAQRKRGEGSHAGRAKARQSD